MHTFSTKPNQSGVMLLEALIGILIFSIGILAMVGLQSLSVKNQADAKYRADASYLANQIIGQMWVDRNNLAAYANNPTPTPPSPTCNPNSAPSANANVLAWAAKVATSLPGATPAIQQIIIGAGNQVTVQVCWKAPQETSYHKYLATAYINQ